jgi:hypothetical protein
MKVTRTFDFIFRMDFNVFFVKLDDNRVTLSVMLKVLLFLN